MNLTRRQFGVISAGVLGSSLTRSLWAREASSGSAGRHFYFAVIADTHSIEDFYLASANLTSVPE